MFAFGDSVISNPRPNCTGDCDWFSDAAPALRAANPGLQLYASNLAVSGTSQPNSWAAANQALNPGTRGQIKFALWQVWSANDGVTSAVIQSDYDTYVPAFVALAHTYGAIPIIQTHPATAQIGTADADATRVSVNNEALALASSSVIVMDLDAAVGVPNPGGIASLKAGYSTDGIHLNATGSAVAAGALEQSIQTWLNTFH